MRIKNHCCGQVRSSDGWHTYRCSREGVIEREGKFYCRQHDPVAVKARHDARDAKWEAEWAAQTAARAAAKAAAERQARLAALAELAVPVLREIAKGHNDPRTLANQFLMANFDDAMLVAANPIDPV